MKKRLADFTVSRSVKEVLIISKSHLDIGFTALAKDVRHAYLKEFIPKAVAIGRKVMTDTPNENYVWNTGSWLIAEYLQYAKGQKLKDFEQAIHDGMIAWHAIPFTTHTELADASLYAAGLQISKELDARFGRSTIAGKMTDVPGHSAGLIKILADAGVEFLHLGVNPSATAPQVPEIFRWRRDGKELVVMYAFGNYGADRIFDRYNLAVIFAHGADNTAPLGVEPVHYLFRQARMQFPDATVRMGTLDDLARKLLVHRADFPVIEQEIGDSWIHGVATDPGKVAKFRELCRLRQKWQTSGKPPVTGFDRNLLLIAEHTWGMDVKTHLVDDESWLRPDFDAARAVRPNYRTLEQSWAEQRDYLRQALKALPPDLRREGKQALRRLQSSPSAMTETSGKPPQLSTAFFEVKFNRRGELSILKRTGGETLLSRPGKPFFGLSYCRYNREDVEQFLGEYCQCANMATAAWARWDLGKEGLPEGLPSDVSRGEQAKYQLIQGRQSTTVIAQVAMRRELTQNAGCPESFEVRYEFPDDAPALRISVRWFGKPANRMPEAIFADFHTNFQTGDDWKLNKMETWIDPLDVVKGGNNSMHAVSGQNSLVIANRDTILAVDSPDAPLLFPGARRLWRFDRTKPDLNQGFHFCLYNNQWGTNFPMWYSDDGLARFALCFNFTHGGSPNAPIL